MRNCCPSRFPWRTFVFHCSSEADCVRQIKPFSFWILYITFIEDISGLNGSYGCPRNESLPYPEQKELQLNAPGTRWALANPLEQSPNFQQINCKINTLSMQTKVTKGQTKYYSVQTKYESDTRLVFPSREHLICFSLTCTRFHHLVQVIWQKCLCYSCYP